MPIEGEPRTPHLTRRALWTGGIATAGMLLIADGMRKMKASDKIGKRQLDEADREAERVLVAQGATRPTTEEINSTKQLAYEISNNPLEERDQEAVRKARDIQNRAHQFKNEFQNRLGYIHAKQDNPTTQYMVGALEVSTGGAVSIFSYPLAKVIGLFSETSEAGKLPPEENRDIDGMTFQEINEAMAKIKRNLANAQRKPRH